MYPDIKNSQNSVIRKLNLKKWARVESPKKIKQWQSSA